MLSSSQKPGARPGWTESAPWMGCSLPALWKILASNHFRIHPSYWTDCLIDLMFATANSSLGSVQRLFYGRSLADVKLVEDPVFIIGHWRTGTTFLHEMLTLDPRLRSPTNYECLAPNHFVLTSRWLKGWSEFTLPRTRPPDQMLVTWDSPQEDEFALCNLGIPSPYATIAFPNHPPQNTAYLELDSLSDAERRRWQKALLHFLKQLTYARPGRLLLKSPTHTFRLPVLARMFPRARWLNVVRNPFAVFPSTVRLWRSLYATYGYQKPHYAGLEEYVVDTFSRMHERLENTRGLVGDGAIVDVRYEDLVRDPTSTLRKAYRVLELGDFGQIEPALGTYLADRAGYVPNQHTVAPPWDEEIRRRWRPYFERYGYSIDDGSVVRSE